VFVTPRTSRAFVQKLIEEARTIKTGHPADPNTDMGISRDPAGMDRMEELIRDAVRKGAAAWTAEGDFRNGSFHTLKGPAILFPVTRQMWILSPEIEIPGPVLCVQEVESMDQAVAEANQSKFGLGASVWSRDLRRAQSIARRLQAGMVWINDSSVGLPRFPWGGTKRSGWGRLFSKEAITELTELKVISRDRRLTSSRKFWWYPYSRAKYEMTLCLNGFLYGPHKRKAFLNFLKESLALIFH
jgi:succinate-semialdehyde dehydrogenase/glutarate-semialdehyde dehydrogenase